MRDAMRRVTGTPGHELSWEFLGAEKQPSVQRVVKDNGAFTVRLGVGVGAYGAH